MKRLLLAGFVLLTSLAAVAGAQEALRRVNLGLILDAPFLHQEELPYENRYSGPSGDEVTRYEYNGRGLPVFIRYVDLQTGTPYLDVDVSYDSDDRLERLVYTSYEEGSDEIAFVDDFSFPEHSPNGPLIGLMTSEEGVSVRIRFSYDSDGRLTELEEDNAFGRGLFRRERYAWVEDLPATETGTLPHAIEVEYPQDAERDRYYLLYDPRHVVRGIQGVNILESAPGDQVAINGSFHYRVGTLEDLFGPVLPRPAESTTALAGE